MRLNDYEIAYDSGYYTYREYFILTKGDNIGKEKLGDFLTYPSLKGFLKVLVDKGEDRVKLIEICELVKAEYAKKESRVWVAKKAKDAAAKLKREMEKKL